MPYYAGDYLVGDPGLFSFIKKAAKVVSGAVSSPLGSIVTGLIPGGGLLKTGLGIVGSLGGALGGSRAGAVTGGTPGAVAAGGALLARMPRFRRTRRARYARRRS